jgi:hypothetical protein
MSLALSRIFCYDYTAMDVVVSRRKIDEKNEPVPDRKANGTLAPTC